MTKDNPTEAMIDAGDLAASAEAPGQLSGDCLAAIYLAMQSAREPKPASPPTGDVVEALTAFIYETTHLSPCLPDGSHNCVISAETLANGRAALATLQPADPVETPELFGAFRTTEAADAEYRMVFKFRTIEQMHEADREWHRLREGAAR